MSVDSEVSLGISSLLTKVPLQYCANTVPLQGIILLNESMTV